MPLIQPMRRPAGTGQPDPARPAVHRPAPAQDAIGDRLVTTELSTVIRKWLWRNCCDGGQSASGTRLRSRSGLARPYICRLIVSIQAASAVLLLVALRDSREAGSGDLWKRRHPGVSGECVAERGLSTRNPTTSTLSSLHGIPTSPGVSGVIVRGVRPSCRRASSSGAAFGRRRACGRGRRRRRSWR
jgi:hypothetical protein